MTSAAGWKSSDPDLFFSKKDPSDLRLGDCVSSLTQEISKTSADLFLWGYPDDEGIQLNGGRIGAAEGPTTIRRVFYKMTPHVLNPRRPLLVDGGDLEATVPLSDRHQRGALRAEQATDLGLHWVSLGGGHDYGYADGAGFLRSQLKKGIRPLILNFDAHLDVRPADKGFHSGTPFYRLLSEFGQQFDFFEIGLQGHCNSRHHWEWALSKGARLIPLVEAEQNGLLATLKSSLQAFSGRPLWVSFDIDSLTSTEAPGCSQSWTTGLRTADLMESFTWLFSNFSWKAFSIYEVSPRLDSDHRTSKVAAQFIHHFLSLRMESKP